MGSDGSDEVDERDRVLAPEDLDITRQPEVAEIDDGRYVVSPNGPAKKPDRDLLENPDWLNDEPDDKDETAPQRRGGPQSQSTSAERSHSEQQPSEQRPEQPTPSDNAQSTQPTPGQQPQNQSTTRSAHSSQPADSHQSPPNQSGRAQSTSTQTEPNQADPSQPDPTPTEPGAERRADQPTNRTLAAHNQPPAEPPAAEITNETVSKFLAQSLAQSSGDYGFDATLNVEGTVNRGRMTSDDIGETLETLLRWYAKQTTDEVEPEHVLGIILAGSDLAVEYPVQSAYEVVKQHGLGPDDTISDLLSAIREDGSFTVPPSKE